jgi:hypothetical protein
MGHQVVFIHNSFYLVALPETDRTWLQGLIDSGILVKTTLQVSITRTELSEEKLYREIYWIDEARSNGKIKLPKRPLTMAQYSVETKPNLN